MSSSSSPEVVTNSHNPLRPSLNRTSFNMSNGILSFINTAVTANGMFIPAITNVFANKPLSSKQANAVVNGDPLKISANKMISSSAVTVEPSVSTPLLEIVKSSVHTLLHKKPKTEQEKIEHMIKLAEIAKKEAPGKTVYVSDGITMNKETGEWSEDGRIEIRDDVQILFSENGLRSLQQLLSAAPVKIDITKE